MFPEKLLGLLREHFKTTTNNMKKISIIIAVAVLFFSFEIIHFFVHGTKVGFWGASRITGTVVQIHKFDPLSDEDLSFDIDVNGDGKADYTVTTNSTMGDQIVAKCIEAGLKEEESSDSQQIIMSVAPKVTLTAARQNVPGDLFTRYIIEK